MRIILQHSALRLKSWFGVLYSVLGPISTCFPSWKTLSQLTWKQLYAKFKWMAMQKHFLGEIISSKCIVSRAVTIMCFHSKKSDSKAELLCILTSERMLAQAFAWSKMIKIIVKLVKKYYFHHAYVSALALLRVTKLKWVRVQMRLLSEVTFRRLSHV